MSKTRSQRFLRDNLPTAVWVLVFAVAPLLFGFLSVQFGKDNNWDLRNYHYYNAYAFLNHRLDLDIAPAQLQTYYNPLLDLPFYYMSRHFPARLVGWMLGFAHGFNFSLVFLITWLVLKIEKPANRCWLALGSSIVAVIAPGFLSVLGNTMNDDIVSLFVLGALALILAAQKAPAGRRGARTGWPLVAAGLLLGAILGLKLTAATYGLSAAIAVAAVAPSWTDRWRRILSLAAGSVAGALATAGFWWLDIYLRFGNPFFPYFNNIFRSPFASPEAWRDTSLGPRSVWEYLVWPLWFSLDGLRVNKTRLSDIRFGLLYVLALAAIVWAVVHFLQRRKDDSPLPGPRLFERPLGDLVLVFFASSYVFWVLFFPQYRYLIPLELLVPLCFLLTLDRLPISSRLAIGVACIAALPVFVLFKPPDWGRLPWSDPYISVNTGNLHLREDGLVVMLGQSPMSYVIPSFPGGYRFIHPESNLLPAADKFQLSRQIHAELQEYKSAVYVLYDAGNPAFNLEDSLSRLGLYDLRKCLPLETRVHDRLELCLASVYRSTQ